VAWSVLVVCALLTACAGPGGNPQPIGTLEPSITQSSPEPSKPEPNSACKMLTSEEREDLGHLSMDAEVPVKPAIGTEECVWTHSLTEPARAAIRVIALEGSTWAGVARPQIGRALGQSTNRTLIRKLEQALVDLSNATELTDERICEIYFTYTEAYGMARAEELLFYGSIGALPAVFAASCEDGRVVMAGFGEYGLRGSIAANHAATRLLEAAKDRADEVLRDAEADDEGTTEDDAGADGEESPDPEPSPNEADESGAGNEEDS
jgi:hypothetical protein